MSEVEKCTGFRYRYCCVKMSMKFTANFMAIEMTVFPMKIFDVFIISAKTMDCEYLLEPPH